MNKIYQKPFPDVKNAGFTLIELLVVVLIIGILAAVALPQYNQAILKSKLAEAVTVVKSLDEAEKVYYMSTGTYTTDPAELDIAFPLESGRVKTKYGYCILSEALSQRRVYCSVGDYLTYHRFMDTGKSMCCSYPESNYRADGICQTEIGTSGWANGCGERNCHCYTSN